MPLFAPSTHTLQLSPVPPTEVADWQYEKAGGKGTRFPPPQDRTDPALHLTSKLAADRLCEKAGGGDVSGCIRQCPGVVCAVSPLENTATVEWNKEVRLAVSSGALLLETMKTVTNEALTMQKEIDIRCQHKISEMVALMEKHKHQYDKTVEKKDTELEYYKTKEQELLSTTGSLERELSCKKNELSSLQEQLKAEMHEKESLAREAKKDDISKKEKKHKKTQTSFLETPKVNSLYSLTVHSKKSSSQNCTPINANKLEYTEKSSWTPAKTYTVKTPPKSKLLRESTNLLSEDGRKKRRKVLLEMDTGSDSSEKNDLLSIMSEEEMFKQLYKGDPQTSCLNVMTPKKIQTPSTLKTPGSSVKLAAIRKMRDAGWTAVSKLDRRRKIKEAGQLFA